MKVGIVGGGITGLSAARELKAAGHHAVVFERSADVGGRASTMKIGPYVFDTGATTVAPRGRPLEKFILQAFKNGELVRIEKPIFIHSDWRLSPGDKMKNSMPRYTFRHGMTEMAKALAEGIDLRLNQGVEWVERLRSGGYALNGQEFDAAIITSPLPEAGKLLESIGEHRPLGNGRYRSCLSILLAFEHPLETPYYALIDPEQRVPLTWLSIESAKAKERAPEGHTALVVQLSPRASAWHMDGNDDDIIREALIDVQRLLGQPFGRPVVSQVKRWKHSQPEMTVSFESMNCPGTRLVVAGDGLVGGRLEFAYDVGIRAAMHIMEDR